MNIVTKTGTDHPHGSVWEFVRNDVLNWPTISIISPELQSRYTQNQYGFTDGGRSSFRRFITGFTTIRTGRLLGGVKSDQGITALAGNPIASEVGGDFSDLLTGQQARTSTGAPAFDALGRPIMVGQLYNPYTTRTVNGQPVRDPIPNNNIPSSMPLNAVALTYLNATYYAPNFGPGGNSYPNYSYVGHNTITSNQFGTIFDHVFHNNDTVFAKFYYSQPDEINLLRRNMVQFRI